MNGRDGNAEPREWWLKTPEGLLYGPAAATTLDDWATAGRLDAECELRRDSDAQWRSAIELYPALRDNELRNSELRTPPPAFDRQAAVSAATHTLPHEKANAGAKIRPSPANTAAGREPASHAPLTPLTPHRGEQIVLLGIAGCILGPPLAIPALLMGTHDLAEIDRGRLAPAGRWLVLAGSILGWFSVIAYGSLLLIMVLLSLATWFFSQG